jgi:hypothetical protein
LEKKKVITQTKISLSRKKSNQNAHQVFLYQRRKQISCGAPRRRIPQARADAADGACDRAPARVPPPDGRGPGGQLPLPLQRRRPHRRLRLDARRPLAHHLVVPRGGRGARARPRCGSAQRQEDAADQDGVLQRPGQRQDLGGAGVDRPREGPHDRQRRQGDGARRPARRHAPEEREPAAAGARLRQQGADPQERHVLEEHQDDGHDRLRRRHRHHRHRLHRLQTQPL